MPGQPLKKIKQLTAVAEQLNKIASDFDALLPPVYRADGRPPTRDARANAWRAADKSILIATAALGDLLTILRERAVQPAGFDGEIVSRSTVEAGLPFDG